MGIACLCAYESWTGRTRVFMEDNVPDFIQCDQTADWMIGFNNLAFDNAVIEACWCDELNLRSKSIDLLAEIWNAAGLARTYQGKSHNGFGLDACCKANGIGQKSGNGAMAPIDYQLGNIGALIDYCLNDIAMTKALFDRIDTKRFIVDPTNSYNRLEFDDWPLEYIWLE